MYFARTKLVQAAFTLVEIMMAVAIIALLVTIALPNFMRARKRSQASQIVHDLRFVDATADHPA
jgi:prepilin-type N-terminal cleavage/methylation domain-containing protein